MTKISVTGSRKHLRDVIDTLHSLELLDVEDYDGELGKGDPFEEAEDLSELLVDIRSVLSKLPEVETSDQEFYLESIEDELPAFSRKLESEIADRENLKAQKKDIKNTEKFFRQIRGSGVPYGDLKGTETLDVVVGSIDEEVLANTGSHAYEIYSGDKASIVFYREDELEDVVREAASQEHSIPQGDFTGTPEKILGELENREASLEKDIESKKKEIGEMAQNWRGRLESAEDYLSQRIEKAEAPLMFGTTENAFLAKGWIPSDSYDELEERLSKITEGKIHIQEEDLDDEEQPPVKHENNRVVEPFESLTDLVSVPKYNELDPSFILFLTFPLFFGFMIGDAGYGITSLLVFYGGYRMFEKAQPIFKSLMWASFFTFIFGLAFGDAFGYVIFGSHSILAELTGMAVFKEIPVLFHRAEHLGQVFYWAAGIGFAHVNMGYLLGAYNEYMNHGIKEAVLEKGSWLVLEAGALLWYFQGAMVGAPLTLVALGMLVSGEGVEGIIEIPSLVSNILSYLRLFGVSVAAVSLAQVVNSMAHPLLTSGSLMGLTFGVLILMIGHTFNTFIKIMEGFLQGIRLHYVEMFDKFYEGGGRKYAPFGAEGSK